LSRFRASDLFLKDIMQFEFTDQTGGLAVLERSAR